MLGSLAMERDNYIAQIQSGPLSGERAMACADSLLDGQHTDQQGAAILVALAERGESVAEITAFADAILARAVAPPHSVVGGGIDLAGTGGSGLERFNVSTTAALVTAALGVKVVKHGNRGSRQPNGSFDFLELLEMPFDLTPSVMAAVHQHADLALFFARAWHPAIGAVVGARKAAGHRTIFNLAAPLCNPASPPFQVLGASDFRIAETLAEVLRGLGRQRALVMCGHPGIEDFSTSGTTQVFELRDGEISGWQLEPADLGVPTADYEALPRGDASANAATFRQLAAGLPFAPPLSALADVVAINAAAALYCAGEADSIAAATSRCREAIDAGVLGRQRQRYIEAAAAAAP